MTSDEPFIDYYAILRVNPDCSQKVLDAAYRQLAKRYHPDHPETADAALFDQVLGAYRALRNPDNRAEYNIHYSAKNTRGFQFADDDGIATDERSALGDAAAHAKILMALYKRRRENAQDAGVIRFYIQQMLECSDENFEFHVWYLKAKGLIETTEHGTLAITIEGVDHVISMSRTAVAEKLLIGQVESDQRA